MLLHKPPAIGGFGGKGISMAETSMRSALDAGEGFRVGHVFSRAFDVLSRHFVMFLLLTAIPSLPYLFIVGGQRPTTAADFQHLGGGGGGLLLLLGWLLSPIIQAIVLYGTFQDMRGKSFGFAESFRKGLARFFPIIGAAICFVFMVFLGTILLVVPGFIFMSMYYVSIPACVVERAGPIASLKRSAELTRGHRWKVLGVALVLALVGGIVAAIIGGVFGATGGLVFAAVGSFVWRTVYGAYSAIVLAVMYYELRVAKEGIDIDRLAAVFD
jgi:hypothetical protein